MYNMPVWTMTYFIDLSIIFSGNMHHPKKKTKNLLISNFLSRGRRDGSGFRISVIVVLKCFRWSQISASILFFSAGELRFRISVKSHITRRRSQVTSADVVAESHQLMQPSGISRLQTHSNILCSIKRTNSLCDICSYRLFLVQFLFSEFVVASVNSVTP